MNESVVSVKTAAGEDEHRVGDDEVHDVGQDVPAHDVALAAADDPGPVDEHPLLDRQRLRPDDPGGRRPARDADDDDDDDAASRGSRRSRRRTPMMSRMIGARMIASTNVGRTRKKSVIAHEDADRSRPPTNPDTIADQGADDDRDDRRQQPDDHRDPRAVDGQVEHVPAELVGPERCARRLAARGRPRSRW